MIDLATGQHPCPTTRMAQLTKASLTPDTVIEGPFWPGPVRVIRASEQGTTVRIEAVGVVDSQYYDRTIPADQLRAQVSEVSGGRTPLTLSLVCSA